ncbi:FtsQ-type POTRA domain-containing protein [Corynebacterium bovis]|uniref:cell division protein FtsQ/DivIB n=1 Tax=Corynebacterium bovis TaxID=36808 RepID=UPI002448A8A1|nr:FtsQ-type POTRA domain-containing protein [Corynebacterium bovis]MDH2455944.1 FtsQ-type POTRA domain-containing protein [Corynebacterium bovis]
MGTAEPAVPARRPRRRVRRRVVAAVVVVLAVVVAAVLYLSPLLAVRTIEVDGVSHLDPAQVEQSTGVRRGQNMLRVDTGAAARDVAALPWVEKVTVARSWPSTVTVHVTEHTPTAVVEDGGDPVVLDADGVPFLRGETPEGVVRMTEVDPRDTKALAAGARAVAALPPEVRSQLERVEVRNAENIRMVFPEGRDVYWGSAERAADKAEATRVVLLREGAHWNVSDPRQPSVR